MLDSFEMMNYRNNMGYTTELKISGHWLDQNAFDHSLGSAIEDLVVQVEYHITDESFDHEHGTQRGKGVEFKKIMSVYGELTGADYSGKLPSTPTLIELLEDTIMETQEM